MGLGEEGLFEVDPAAAGRPPRRERRGPGRNVSGVGREAEGGGVWIATSDLGAFRWDGGATSKGSVRRRVSGRAGLALLEDREGIVWSGPTRASRRGPSAFRTYGPEDGSRRSPLYGMAETPDGTLWFGGHDRGLLRRAEDGTFRLYTAKDGFPTRRSARSACRPKGT